jgi:hypothetical protein
MVQGEGRDGASYPSDDDDDDDDEDDVAQWDFKNSPRLAGPVASMKVLRSKFGKKQRYTYLEIGNVDNKVTGWHAAQTVAKSQLNAVQAQVGDVLDIRYRGWKQGGNGTGYHDFSIKSNRKIEVDWDDIGSDDDDET